MSWNNGGDSSPMVLIITLNQMAHTGLHTLISASMGANVCFMASGTPQQMLSFISQRTVLVIWFIDPHSNLTGTLGLLRDVRRRYPAVSWLILTDILAGVFAWVAKHIGGITVVDARLSLEQLDRLISSCINSASIPRDIRLSEAANLLSWRQREVLELTSRIDCALKFVTLHGLSHTTVGVHRMNLVKKLQLHNYRDLLRYPGLSEELMGMMPLPYPCPPEGSPEK